MRRKMNDLLARRAAMLTEAESALKSGDRRDGSRTYWCTGTPSGTAAECLATRFWRTR